MGKKLKKIPFRTGLTDSEETLSERSEISFTRVHVVPNDINDDANIPNKDQGPVEDKYRYRW